MNGWITLCVLGSKRKRPRGLSNSSSSMASTSFVLVLGVAVDRLERAHDDLRGVVALAREAVGHLAPELLPELLHEALVGRVVEQRRVEVAGDDAEGRLALGGQHVGLGEEARRR